MILCCGEALIDMLPRETAEGEPAFAPHPGGSVFNTAIALGRLGAPAGWFGGLSTDLFGTMLDRALSESRVDTTLAVRSDRPTTLAFVTLTDGHARYAFYDENTAGRMLAPADMPQPRPEVRALFFGGISLVAEPAADALAAFCEDAGDRVVMLDPNIRAGFVTDETRYRERLAGMLARADIVKISDEDMAWLNVTPADLLGLGAALVVVTKGADGVDAHLPGEMLRVPARPVTVVDTVGAGDTFNAGLLAGLDRAVLLDRAALRAASGDALEPALTLGVAAAAITVSRAGANPPWDNEL
ncbi:carbohydrate kinase family protein [Citreimonas salinaria]|uniref:Fructokinase n=1 Tax=Citreimonas salinaria TaxID=321339 RepID=A0A1H3I0M8_9RHOB|nr:carbohydrate kinase [Citreimonas salinaria]SDY21260.1 fructokinase [Citreimonas salinaria]